MCTYLQCEIQSYFVSFSRPSGPSLHNLTEGGGSQCVTGADKIICMPHIFCLLNIHVVKYNEKYFEIYKYLLPQEVTPQTPHHPLPIYLSLIISSSLIVTNNLK